MTKFKCPGCDYVVEISHYDPISMDDYPGCHNIEEHDDGGPLVMYPQ